MKRTPVRVLSKILLPMLPQATNCEWIRRGTEHQFICEYSYTMIKICELGSKVQPSAKFTTKYVSFEKEIASVQIRTLGAIFL